MLSESFCIKASAKCLNVNINYLHLGVRVLHPCRVSSGGVVRVSLVIVQVEGFFAGSVRRAPRRALDHGEPQLHVHLRRPSPLDQLTAQPVTGGAVVLTYLIGPNAVVLFIQTAYLLPLHVEAGQREETDGNWPTVCWTYTLIYSTIYSFKCSSY